MKIAFFDLEGTLVEGTAWNEIKDKFGAKDLSDKYDKLYDEGKVTYEEWRRKLVETWRESKVTREDFVNALKDYKLIPGGKELIAKLKEKGYKVIVITGAISIFAEMLQEELGFDEMYCGHEFTFDENSHFLNIETHEKYQRGQGKVYFIKKIIEKEGVSKKDCIAIGGDDINDYWMMKELRSFAVRPHLRKIQDVVDHDVSSLIEILEYV
jgi:phosphoserine phosphatase